MTVSLLKQGNISGDEVVPNAHTYYPSLDVSPDGVVAIGYSLSATNFELSSLLSFLGPRCGVSDVAQAPDFLRRGATVWLGAGGRWGDYSDTVWDSGTCFWSHNAHPIVGPNPASATWQTSVGKFCIDPSLVFRDGFESGTTAGWCSAS